MFTNLVSKNLNFERKFKLNAEKFQTHHSFQWYFQVLPAEYPWLQTTVTTQKIRIHSMKNQNGFRNLHQRPGRRLRGVEWRTRENEAEFFRRDTCMWSARWRSHSPVRIASVIEKKKKWGWLRFWERGGGREGGGDSCSALPLPAWFFNFLLLCWRNLRLRESERLWFTA